jgi:hypothetical protein
LNSLSTHKGVKPVWISGVSRIAGVVLSVLVAAAVGLAGCAAVKPRSAEEIVKERAQARWDALVKGDTGAAYGYMSPASRSITSPEAYARSLRAGFWKSAVVDKIECRSAQSCDALATIEYEHSGRRTKTPLRETWIFEGSEWWYLHK